MTSPSRSVCGALKGASSSRELPVSHDAVALAQRHWTRVLR